jgi:hypothetical protein
MREEAFEERVGEQEGAISEALADPCARVVKSVAVDDVARDAETKASLPRGSGRVTSDRSVKAALCSPHVEARPRRGTIVLFWLLWR